MNVFLDVGSKFNSCSTDNLGMNNGCRDYISWFEILFLGMLRGIGLNGIRKSFTYWGFGG